MAICNLFRTLSKETGNFMMFGQYADDLTKHHVQYHSYKVVPKKFVALDIDYSKLSKYAEELGLVKLNDLLPAYLQDYFENGCAFLKTDHDNWDSTNYNPEIASNLFWNAMINSELITLNEDIAPAASEDSVVKTIDQIRYIGNIDIHSYEQKDGMGYSEIYCYIPNNAQRTIYKAIVNESKSNKIHCDNAFVEGYGASTKDIKGTIGIELPPSGIDYEYEKTCDFLASRTAENESLFTEVSESGMLVPTDDRSFTFNTVVVLYDILCENDLGEEVVEYRDVPLGMYVTGLIQEEDGSVTNSVLKYTTCDDAYGSGTSYGLRICSRFTVTPNSTIMLDTELELKDQYAGFSEAMSAMAESQQAMDEVLSQVVEDSQNIKNELAQFKNYRTNVPYIKEIDGKPYWFINGRCTYVVASGATGSSGKDGVTPTISSDGRWVINGVETEYPAIGSVGPIGPTGPTGPTGATGATGPQGMLPVLDWELTVSPRRITTEGLDGIIKAGFYILHHEDEGSIGTISEESLLKVEHFGSDKIVQFIYHLPVITTSAGLSATDVLYREFDAEQEVWSDWIVYGNTGYYTRSAGVVYSMPLNHAWIGTENPDDIQKIDPTESERILKTLDDMWVTEKDMNYVLDTLNDTGSLGITYIGGNTTDLVGPPDQVGSIKYYPPVGLRNVCLILGYGLQQYATGASLFEIPYDIQPGDFILPNEENVGYITLQAAEMGKYQVDNVYVQEKDSAGDKKIVERTDFKHDPLVINKTHKIAYIKVHPVW